MLTTQDRKWLDLIRMASTRSRGSLGERDDLLPPKVLRRLERAGFVDRITPHNPVHKDRIVITEAGREALAANPN